MCPLGDPPYPGFSAARRTEDQKSQGLPSNPFNENISFILKKVRDQRKALNIYIFFISVKPSGIR